MKKSSFVTAYNMKKMGKGTVKPEKPYEEEQAHFPDNEGFLSGEGNDEMSDEDPTLFNPPHEDQDTPITRVMKRRKK